MDITAFSESYRAAVIDLWQSCGLVVPWNDPNKDIDRKLAVNPELFLLGLKEGELVATVMGGYEGHRGWINYLAVAPDYQKQGLGRAMMAAIEHKLKALGCPKINLQIRSANTDVIGFYKALDFAPDPVVSMGKRLTSDV